MPPLISMSCIDNIVTLGICPDAGASLSGLTLLQAAGMSPKNMANIATEQYVQGTTLAMQKKELAIIQFQNDFIGALQANKVATTITNTEYETAVFNTTKSVGIYYGERGTVLHKNLRWKGNLRRTFIKEIQLYPFASGDVDITLSVGNNTYTYPVTLVANQVNVFDSETLGGFPFEIPYYVHNVTVKVDNSTIQFASADILCKTGCGGTLPNDCCWADGWDGEKQVRKEGYGVNLVFYCHCDYEKIICDLSKSFTGELIWLKWQIAIFDEQYKSNRFTNWVIYNQERLPDIINDLNNQYNKKWNDLMNGLFAILQNYKDDCLNCRGIRWKTNV